MGVAIKLDPKWGVIQHIYKAGYDRELHYEASHKLASLFTQTLGSVIVSLSLLEGTTERPSGTWTHNYAQSDRMHSVISTVSIVSVRE